MVPKLESSRLRFLASFRAVLFRMVPKHMDNPRIDNLRFRAVLFRMVPKQARNSMIR